MSLTWWKYKTSFGEPAIVCVLYDKNFNLHGSFVLILNNRPDQYLKQLVLKRNVK